MLNEVQTIEAHGTPRTEYHYQPEHPTDLEEGYTPNMKLIQRGEQDKIKRIPPRFPANGEYMRGYKAPCAHYLTVIQDDSAERSHFLITLVHRKTKQEKLVDLLTDTDEFAAIRNILNCHDYQEWGIFEILDFDCPF